MEELGLFAEILAEVPAELQRRLSGQDDGLRLGDGGPGGQAGRAVHAREREQGTGFVSYRDGDPQLQPAGIADCLVRDPPCLRQSERGLHDVSSFRCARRRDLRLLSAWAGGTLLP
jgi:hypothetical protein